MVFVATPFNIESILNFYANQPVRLRAMNQTKNVVEAKKNERMKLNQLTVLRDKPIGETSYKALMDSIHKVLPEIHANAERERSLYPSASANNIAKLVFKNSPTFKYQELKKANGVWKFFNIPSTALPAFGSGFDDIEQATVMMEALIRIADSQAADDCNSSPPGEWSPLAMRRAEQKAQVELIEKDGEGGAKKTKHKKRRGLIIDVTGDGEEEEGEQETSAIIKKARLASTTSTAASAPSMDSTITAYMKHSMEMERFAHAAANPFSGLWEYLTNKNYHKDGTGLVMTDILHKNGCLTAEDAPLLLEMTGVRDAVLKALLPVPAEKVRRMTPQAAVAGPMVTPKGSGGDNTSVF